MAKEMIGHMEESGPTTAKLKVLSTVMTRREVESKLVGLRGGTN